MPRWGLVKPFALKTGSQFRPSGPPALDSPRYAADVNEVKAIGSVKSASRTPDQAEIAIFWSDFTYTSSPPGHWNDIARDITSRKKPPLIKEARLFALLNIALADASIATWDAKYVYNFWRPVTAIRSADPAKNSAIERDSEWLPLLNTPAHPEYVSGHSAFSAAAATILTAFFGKDAIHFEVGSDAAHGKIRAFDSLATAVDEIGLSRIYGGIHFRSAIDDGKKCGDLVAKFVLGNKLKPRKI